MDLACLQNVSLKKLAAQTIVVRTTGFLFDDQLQYPQWEVDAARLKHLIQDVGIGGVILLGASTAEVALKIEQMQGWAEVPLLICADIEEGIGQRFPGATWFPPPMALAGVAKHDLNQAIALAEQMGAVIAQEALAIGMNWLLTPTVDVNNNPDNPVINVRAFGETPDVVSAITAAYIRGAQQFPVLTTAKHFPGHGDTAIDSHLALPTIDHDLDRLNAVELAPFRAAIAMGVDAVMSAHLHVPALDAEYPTTFSRKVMTDLLRGEMGFDGVIVTDALVMGAIADRYGNVESVVQSIIAGVDVILMPVDAVGAIEAIVQAVESGRVTREQLEQAVARIWTAKQKVVNSPGLPGGQFTTGRPHQPITADRLIQQLAQPAAAQTVEAIVRESIATHNFQQIQPVTNGRNLILTDTLLDSRLVGRLAPAVTLPPHHGFRQLELVDRNTPEWRAGKLVPTVLQLLIRGNPLRGIQETVAQAKAILMQLIETQQLAGLVLYGSPYVFEMLTPLLPDRIPAMFSYGQIEAAQTIVLQQIFSPVEASVNNKEGMF
ncbi:beta-glucosidase [filamentous cyanobacterium LEGE 11480]|uniref:beta-N-acetylhexosaminidase n=1 Tax=Romeriopsis navalis LEGE 11480 TaxID=2777977 RepID=A0A928Z508_9CYAN|nr:glycoside hydrolase family 3 N-terminal domain-containing protein [Romeriopsis navalis]MBE9032299.1 beta-glucosidase [Romeriopsis navalis LEGE 11480]